MTEPVLGVDYDVVSIWQTDRHGFAAGVQPLVVHGPARCEGQWCTIHNPSGHHMNEWPQLWRADRKLMERTCPHDIGHPDPDDTSLRSVAAQDVHGCDGCCRPYTGYMPTSLGGL